MTLAEIEEQIRVLKEQKSRTAEREKQEHRKLLTHRKIQLGGTLSSILADSGIDICSIERDVFEKEMLPKLHSYYVKYALVIKKLFQELDEENNSIRNTDPYEETGNNSYMDTDNDNDEDQDTFIKTANTLSHDTPELSISFLDTDDDPEDM